MPRLGARGPPAGGDPAVRAAPLRLGGFAQLGCRPTLRETDGKPFVTDNGNWILDCGIAAQDDAAALDRDIRRIPGVVDTGFFLGTAERVLVAEAETVRVLRRAGDPGRANGRPPSLPPTEDASMELGFIGLGRMGMNMVIRLVRGGHRVVVYNRSPEKVREATGTAPSARRPWRTWSRSSRGRGPSGSWCPPGAATQDMIDTVARHLDRDDIVIDGGNTNFHDDVRRAEALKQLGLRYMDVGTSGGIWGLQVGYCLMVGRRRGGLPSSRAALPDARARERLRPHGRPRRRPLREDGPQRHRVRHDAGHRGGLRADAQEPVRARAPADRRPLDAGQRRALLAGRAGRPGALGGSRAPEDPRVGGGLGRGALDRAGRDRSVRARLDDHGRALHPVPLPRGGLVRRHACSPRFATSSAATPSGPGSERPAGRATRRRSPSTSGPRRPGARRSRPASSPSSRRSRGRERAWRARSPRRRSAVIWGRRATSTRTATAYTGSTSGRMTTC